MIRSGGGVLAVAAVLASVVLAPASAEISVPSKSGGTLVVALTRGEPSTLDPTLSSQLTAVEIYRTMCEKLYDVDANLHVVPQLAAALPVLSKDKLAYTIRLRHGVRFNDGTPFRAQAVAETIRRNQTLPGSTRASDLTPIRSITSPGPYTVVLHLAAPYTPLPVYLAAPAAAIMSPTQLAKLGDASFGTNPVCVGPFMFDDRVPGDSVTVVRSPYYYDRKDVLLDRIVFMFLNSTTAAAALKAGDVQAVDSVSAIDVAALRQTSGLRVIPERSLAYEAVTFNVGNHGGVNHLPYGGVDTAFARSPALRKAFEEAIDRTAIARLFAGAVLPGCTPISPVSDWFDPSVRCTPFDPADARKLVAASGAPDPSVHLLTANAPDLVRLAQFVESSEEAVGIRVTIDVVDGATLNARMGAGAYEAALDGWSGGIDPDRNMFDFLATSGSRDSPGYSNPRLDLVLANGRKALSETSRRTYYRVAQQIVLADRPRLYLYHPIGYAAVSSRVSGVQAFADTHLRVWSAQLG
jgi:peptide/nickel transport system substrate-binding protein